MNVIDNSLCEYEASFQLTSNLKDDIIRQSDLSSPSDANNKALKDLKYKKNAVNKIALEELREQMTPHQLKANDIARCDSAFIWLTTLPLKEENYVLNKKEFFDDLYMRYMWEMKNLQASVHVMRNLHWNMHLSSWWIHHSTPQQPA